MNNNSFICKFIQEHPDTWQQELDNMKIKYKTIDNYTIFNYDIDVDFLNPLVQECRGIIIDDNLNVVCWPFRKFGNYTESYADEIDWSTARVQEKLDGSILKLWCHNNRWYWSTNSQIYIDAHFDRILKSCINYTQIEYSQLDKNITYIFELTAPDNQIVIKYSLPKLYHIGSRNNQTGEELNLDIGIEKPIEYPLYTLQQCIEIIEYLNDKDTVEHEGFVVVDANWHRIKIKTPEYFMWHRLVNNHSFRKDYFLDLIINKPELVAEFIENFPEYEHIVRFYQWQYSEFQYQATKFVEYSKNLLAEYSYERKALALQIKDNKYAAIAFKCIDTSVDTKEYINNMPLNKILKFIEEYEYE